MNILLLGATGYLGCNIAKKLCDSGHNITCVIRISSDTSILETLPVDYISNDLDSIELYLRHNPVDWIINGVCSYNSNKSLYADLLVSNTIFPLNVLNLAIKYGVKGFLTMGTSLPNDFNLYSFSKHELSRFGRFLSFNDGIKFIDLQLEMFYGGFHEPNNRFISSVKQKLLNNDDIMLTEGFQKRDIIRVEDITEIVYKLLVTNYGNGFMALPVGTGESHSIREIVKFMKKEMKSSSNLLFGAIPSRKSEPDTLAHIDWYKDIDFKLKYTYFDGLKDMCENKY
ncbi:MAG: NAD(P)-dependent oxidoreductase [Candidatus Riflebacteria bacterium]|nr:NAD(P)-dependent oxidoreductase [Candidatus Riflebacteria bacterium]